jgi:Manganese-stabilising protein / photosystem II polypeptide
MAPPVSMQISGSFKVDGSGNVEFVEEDGIDYAAVTVQVCLPDCKHALFRYEPAVMVLSSINFMSIFIR